MNRNLIKYLLLASFVMTPIATKIIPCMYSVNAQSVKESNLRHVVKVSIVEGVTNITFTEQTKPSDLWFTEPDILSQYSDKLVVRTEDGVDLTGTDILIINHYIRFTNEDVDLSNCKIDTLKGIDFGKKVKKVTLPKGLKTIESGVFGYCELLEEVNMPDSITSIEDSAFIICQKLKTINFSDNITSIGKNAFKECKSLTDIKLPKKLKTIGEQAFYWTVFYGDLVIPDSVTHIGKEAFRSAGFKGNIILGNGLIEFSNAFEWCRIDGDLTISDKVKTIGKNAFNEASIKGEIKFPSELTTIEEGAFQQTGIYTDLKLPHKLVTIGNSAFWNSNLKGDLIIPDSVIEIGYRAFRSCDFDGQLKLGKNVKTIGDESFRYCSNLKGDLIIPDSVTEIGEDAFRDCSDFDGQLKIGNNVNSIGENAFTSCYNLKGEVIIPRSVSFLPKNAFTSVNNISILLQGPKVNELKIGDGYIKGSAGNQVKLLNASKSYVYITLISPTVKYPREVLLLDESGNFEMQINELKGGERVEVEAKYSYDGGKWATTLKSEFYCKPLKPIIYSYGLDYVEGKTSPNIKVRAVFNKKNYEESSDYAGNFKINIPGLKIGDKITIYSFASSDIVSDTVDVVIKPSMPNISTITTTLVKGKADANIKVTVRIGDKYYSTKSNKNGNYSIKIPTQKPGTKVKVYSKYGEDLYSDIREVILTPTKPTITTATTTLVKGKADANIKVAVRIGNKYYSAKSTKNGNYSIKIPKQKPGTKVKVYSKYGKDLYSDIREVILTPTKPTITTATTTLVKGKADANIKVTVRIGNKYYSAKSTKNGNYSIKIPKQKYGTKIKVYSKYSNIYSEIRELKIKPKTPTASTLTRELVKGKADANIKVTVRIGNKYYSAKSTKNGNYSIKIPKQKYGTKIKVYSKSSNGIYSDIRELTIKK